MTAWVSGSAAVDGTECIQDAAPSRLASTLSLELLVPPVSSSLEAGPIGDV